MKVVTYSPSKTPEIIETTLVAEGLASVLTGHSIVLISINCEEGVRFFRGLNHACSQLTFPLSISKVGCHGKQIYIVFTDASGRELYGLSNLGMTGSWLTTPQIHSHLELHLDTGVILYYNDARKFGNFQIAPSRDSLAPSIFGEHRGTEDQFRTALTKARLKWLVTALMDQRLIVSGIGNYLLSEILYRSRISPDVRCSDLSPEQVTTLYQSCLSIAEASYRAGGMSMKDYVNLYGKKGEYIKELKVYGRTVTDDGHPIVKATGHHGRSIYYDPLVQG